MSVRVGQHQVVGYLGNWVLGHGASRYWGSALSLGAYYAVEGGIWWGLNLHVADLAVMDKQAQGRDPDAALAQAVRGLREVWNCNFSQPRVHPHAG